MVFHHAARQHDPRARHAEDAGLPKLRHQGANFVHRHPCHAGQGLVSDRGAVEHQVPIGPGLVHDAEALDPEAARREADGPEGLVAPPRRGLEFEPGLTEAHCPLEP